MTGIIVASHGGLAEGVLSSVNMVFGPQDDLVAVTLTPDIGPEEFQKRLLAGVESLSSSDQVVFLVDLLGGTPFNQASAILHGHEDNWAIVTGLSLPMLMAALCERMDDEEIKAHDMARNILAPSREGISVMPESLAETVEEEQAPAEVATAPVAAGGIPEGTVLGDGHIKYALCRIDSRLLHGQVATAWTKKVQPDRIIVVSDAVAKDELRKALITKAAPPGVKAHVIPLKKLVEVDKDPRFGATRALLLFENPHDLLSVLKQGVGIKNVNLGSMAHSEGKVMVNRVVSMDASDVAAFEEMKKLGIEFEVRKVPADSADDLDAMLKTAKSGLNK